MTAKTDDTIHRNACARLLAVEVLLSDPAALGNDALEADLYILRAQLRTKLQLPPAPAE